MANESFELTNELIEQIIFAMENQKEKFFLDPAVPSIVSKSAEGTGNRISPLYDLPDWEPSDGYRLMEQFVLNLRNPVYREHLSSILHCGSGVFRKFKDALNQRPDIERKWFSFKELNMKRRVLDWYNILRLEWGLDVWEEDFNGEYSPVLTDFSIDLCREEQLPRINRMDRDAFSEIYQSCPSDYISDLFRRFRDGFEPEISEESRIFLAESPDGEIVGFVWITAEVLEKGTVLGRIRQIYVLPEYRGLGLAEKLKEKALEDSMLKSCSFLEIDVPAGAEFIMNNLIQYGFKKNSTMLVLSQNAD
ncbi:GNAT family N-acetyltransferase [Spirochaeta isovalerica]|uniref:Ribosomal protein S18 acetylase RimI-like enzyme n=1 Tax=Spirochaeta isovalerica TaxID=150 RepID=A0A841RBQ8_9SPIO|nr:GNAT family N-acetyltransferase [Spirochaeta isovalerica]MBB6481136.1 ribosomal protein S18 acetylase RimI-like enzyme [Spirochaeta isovalerica]